MADNANNNNNPAETVAVAVVEDSKPAEAKQENAKKNIISSKIFNVKHISGLLSVVSFIFSLPILAFVIWLIFMKGYDCESLFKLRSLQNWICVGLFFVFLICNASLFLETRHPMLGIIFVMVPLTVMFVAGLALLGANNMESRRIPATPLWFKTKIRDNGLWSNIKSCIYDTGVCQDLAITAMELKSYDLSTKKLSSIESGCCKPPVVCQMQYVNTTFWEKDETVASDELINNTDCDLWRNESDTLCYNCQSCRDGYIKTLQKKWLGLGVFLVVMAVLLIVSHLLLFMVRMWELHVSLSKAQS